MFWSRPVNCNTCPALALNLSCTLFCTCHVLFLYLFSTCPLFILSYLSTCSVLVLYLSSIYSVLLVYLLCTCSLLVLYLLSYLSTCSVLVLYLSSIYSVLLVYLLCTCPVLTLCVIPRCRRKTIRVSILQQEVPHGNEPAPPRTHPPGPSLLLCSLPAVIHADRRPQETYQQTPPGAIPRVCAMWQVLWQRRPARGTSR